QSRSGVDFGAERIALNAACRNRRPTPSHGTGRKFLMPSVPIFGASADRAKYGNKSVRAHLRQGYDVYPVNPKGGEIEGLRAYRTLAAVPVARLNRISVYLPPAVVLDLLDEIAAKRCDEFWLNPGSESA